MCTVQRSLLHRIAPDQLRVRKGGDFENARSAWDWLPQLLMVSRHAVRHSRMKSTQRGLRNTATQLLGVALQRCQTVAASGGRTPA